MSDATFRQTLALGGLVFNGLVSRPGDGDIAVNPTIPAAKAGALTTRTSDTVGVATLAADHGITTGQVVDVFWSGGQRYNVVVGTVSGTAVPLTDGGSPGGDVLPADETAITVSPQTTVTFALDASALQLIALQLAAIGVIQIHATGAGTDKVLIMTANEAFIWYADNAEGAASGIDDSDTLIVSQSGVAAVELLAAAKFDATV